MWFTPAPTERKPLTAIFVQGPFDLFVSGVSEDEDVFRNLAFKTLNEALLYLKERYNPTYKVVCNIPPNVRR